MVRRSLVGSVGALIVEKACEPGRGVPQTAQQCHASKGAPLLWTIDLHQPGGPLSGAGLRWGPGLVQFDLDVKIFDLDVKKFDQGSMSNFIYGRHSTALMHVMFICGRALLHEHCTQ